MYRKGVSALVLNKNKEFLLVNLESFSKEFFAIPGGGVEEGETLENAVYREIEEEVGITRNSLELVGKADNPLRFKFKVIDMIRDNNKYEGSERYFFGFNFIGSNDEVRPKSGEVRSCKWVSCGQLKDYLLFENQLEDTLTQIACLFPDFK